MNSINKNKILSYIDYFWLITGVIAFFSLILLIGFYLSSSQIHLLIIFLDTLIFLLSFSEVVKIILSPSIKNYLKENWIEILIFLLLILNFILVQPINSLISSILSVYDTEKISIVHLWFSQFLIILLFLTRALKYSYLISKIQLHPGAIFALSFATIIIIGTLFLLLPKATPAGKSISFVDALFTSTSAVCVTGLTVLDTAKDFTFVGQLIILLLIQIGGLGVMTLTTFFALFLSGGISIKAKIIMRDLLSQESLSEVSSLLIKITIFTLILESIGAFFIYISFVGETDVLDYDTLFTAIFHSVSAFCNAGFSIFSDNLVGVYHSGNYLFVFVVMILIILGGIGFSVLSNIASIRPWKRRYKRIRYQISLHSKIVIVTTFILIIIPTILILIIEPFNAYELSFGDKILNALFLAITSRTAGFNIVPTETLTYPTVLILIFLMWVGASPGSTGGGIKTTTFALSIMSLYNSLKGKDHVDLFNREIHSDSIKKSYYVIISSIIAILLFTLLLLILEPTKNPFDLIFEVTSALGTVGLSRNITPSLNEASKVLIILTMFVGRIGVLNFIIAFWKTTDIPHYTLPKERVMIG